MSEYSSQLASSTFVLVGMSVGLDVGICVVGDRVGRSVAGKSVGISVGFNEGMTFVEAAPSCCPSPGSLYGVAGDGNSSASDKEDEEVADDDDDVLLLSELRFSDRGTAMATIMAARRAASPAATRHARWDAILLLFLALRMSLKYEYATLGMQALR